MNDNHTLSLALVFLSGFLFSRLVKKMRVPTITAYVGLGILFSPYVLNLIAGQLLAASEFITHVVLGMIAFSLGESFSRNTLRQVGRVVTSISLCASLVPWILVTVIFWLVFKQPFYVSLILGAIAAATDPAATVSVTQEYRSKGEFTDTMLGIVAIDDAWALIIFGLSLSVATSFAAGAPQTLLGVIGDIGKALLVIIGSCVTGSVTALLLNKFSYLINTAKERLIYTLGCLFLAIGVSVFFDCSILLSCMAFGAVLVNTNRTSFEYFNSLREIDSPLYLIFFVLAGAQLNVVILGKVLLPMIGFIFIRAVGKLVGASWGSRFVSASPFIRKYMGIALLPQAGVALGCALVAKHALNNSWGDWVLSVTIATTVFFELIGPWSTKFALVKVGDITE